jgi:diguanylate cyclase (GGDEF)-like protein
MAGVAVGVSYLTVVVGLGTHTEFSAATVASIAIPALVAGLVMVAYIVWDVRYRQSEQGTVSALNAQLVRKEIEIDRLSSVDELTGLHTRYHFMEGLALEYARMKRYDRPLALLLVEIDDSELLGEQARKLSKGYLLSEVAALVKSQLRANDLGGRYTQEVLAVLLPETKLDLAISVADRVRSSLTTREFFGRRFGVEIGLTISQGIAVVPERGIETPDDLLEAAESALRSARTAGTGQIRVYGPPPAPADAGDDEDEQELLAS